MQATATTDSEKRFLRIADVLAIVPVSRPTIYRLMSKGQFPKAVYIGSSTRWLESEITKWLNDKVNSR